MNKQITLSPAIVPAIRPSRYDQPLPPLGCNDHMPRVCADGTPTHQPFQKLTVIAQREQQAKLDAHRAELRRLEIITDVALADTTTATPPAAPALETASREYLAANTDLHKIRPQWKFGNEHKEREKQRARIARTKLAATNLRVALAFMPQPQPLSEVNFMSLSAYAAKLARRYVGIVREYDDPTAYRESGYTPREMELRRTRAHNDFLDQLRAEGICVDDRAATTDFAIECDRWMREDD